jgi:polysaccharide export outer membrane protein
MLTYLARMVSALMLALLALLALPLAAQQAAPPVQPAPQQTTDAAATRESYRIGTGDVLEIGVVGREDYKARVQVLDDGNVQLPLINNVPAAGRTVLELRDAVGTALRSGGYFVNPAINVTVVNYSSRYVTVLGQVTSPGLVPIDRAYRLSEIIARVGGVSGTSVDRVSVTRQDGATAEYRIADLATGGQDPFVADGDKIFVAPAKTFYIYGQVNAPGTYPIDPNMTLRMALARAGGLTNLGSEKRVRMVRGDEELRRVPLSETLREGDVIVVGERFF